MGKEDWIGKVVRLRGSSNDEFYSTPEFVQDFMDKMLTDPKVKPMLKGKVVCCPCDTDESEFVKWFRAHQDGLGLKEVWNFVDYYSPQVLKADFIITNPPFHKVNEWLRWLCSNGKKWAVVKSSTTCYCYRDASLLTEREYDISYHLAGRWAFNRPDGSQGSVDVLYSSNFVDYECLKEAPTELKYMDDGAELPPVYTLTNQKFLSKFRYDPVYYISNVKQNGVPRDAKFVALPYLFECNKIKGWKKVAVTQGGDAKVNGKIPFQRMIWERVNEQ